jgi:hypothetical protein
MIAHGQPRSGIEWLENLSADVRRDPTVRRAETECYVAARDWKGLSVLLERSQWGADDHLRHAFLALSYREQHEEELAQVEWKRAVRAGLPSGTVALVRLASNWRWERETEELLWQVARESRHWPWAADLLAKAYRIQGDTPGLMRVYQLAAERNPENLVARNNFAAASLLLKTNLKSAHQLAREVHLAQPSNAAFACTFAYSLHLQGRTREGLRLLAEFPDEALREPSVAACYSAMLRSQGAFEAAENYVAFATEGSLLPEERLLVDGTSQPVEAH